MAHEKEIPLSTAHKDIVYLARFRSGYGVMGQNAIDYYKCECGLIKEEWGNGYGEKTLADSVPEAIFGYRKLSDEG